MKNNKGFAITSIIYAMLILFLGLIFLILGNLASRKAMFDKEKNEILSRFNGDEDGFKIYKNGEVVYFDVTTGEQCSNYTETQSNTGTKSGCMKFYAFNDDGGDTVNLILDHNTTATVAWNNTYTDDSGKKINAKGPKELLDKLKSDTSSWKGTITPANYTMDQSDQPSKAKYTIDYSNYKARLITAQEVAQITGNTAWNERTAINSFHFDTNTTTASDTCKEGNTSGCQYGWLYDRTATDCTKYGCLNNSDVYTYGYWTASSRADTSRLAWRMNYNADVNSHNVGISYHYGVRPVIEVLKSKLSSNNNTELCTLVSGKAYEIGSKYECELGDNDEKTFFVLETNGDNVSLIMNKNIDSNGKGTTSGNTVAWVTKEDYLAAGGTSNDYGRIGNNKFGPITAEKALKKNTKTWTKLTESQISLPSYDQIYKAAGNKFSGLSTWLYGNLKVNSSIPYGYWTSTPIASRSYGAWRVSYDGYLGGYNDVGYDSNNGVRPVITVSKSNLS